MFHMSLLCASDICEISAHHHCGCLCTGTVAILAIAASKPAVVANEDGLIGVKKQMKVNLTCDHRIVYGAQAAAFLQTLKSVIESPDQLTM